MSYVVLAVWLIQASAGILLFVRWLRGTRRGSPVVLSHLLAALLGLVLWTLFLAQGSTTAAWSAFVVLTAVNAVGDSMLVKRWRRMTGSSAGFWLSYGRAIAAVFAGDMPRWVTFHALFAGVVYFVALGVCIGASIAS